VSEAPAQWTADPDAGTLRRRVAAAPGRLLMLDYDGTLAPFREARDEAVPYPGVRERLERLAAEPAGRVAIVSGRAVEHLAPLIGIDPLPEIFGSHGFEHRTVDGRLEQRPLAEPAERGLEQAREWAREERLDDRLEVKPAGLALHWRGLPGDEIERLDHRARPDWQRIADEHDLHLLAFDGGLELRARDADKGTVVRELLQQAGGDALAAYLGDDKTDEDAFEALAGHGLPVLVRPEPRPTAAERWIRPPEDLLAFLDAWLEGCRAAPPRPAR
jgi:trehalose-phosphatase